MPSFRLKSVLLLGFIFSASALGILFHRPIFSYLNSKRKLKNDATNIKDRKVIDPQEKEAEEEESTPSLHFKIVSEKETVLETVDSESTSPKLNVSDVQVSKEEDSIIEREIPIALVELGMNPEVLKFTDKSDDLSSEVISSLAPAVMADTVEFQEYEIHEAEEVLARSPPSFSYQSPSLNSFPLDSLNPSMKDEESDELLSMHFSSRRESEATVKGGDSGFRVHDVPMSNTHEFPFPYLSSVELLIPSDSPRLEKSEILDFPLESARSVSELDSSAILNVELPAIPFHPSTSTDSTNPEHNTETFVVHVPLPSNDQVSSSSSNLDNSFPSVEMKTTNFLNLDAPAFIPSILTHSPPMMSHEATHPSELLNGMKGELESKYARCHYWPDCKFGSDCVYWHPIHLCPNEKLTGFQPADCPYGSRCYFYHAHELKYLDSNGLSPPFERSKGLTPPNYHHFAKFSVTYDSDEEEEEEEEEDDDDDEEENDHEHEVDSDLPSDLSSSSLSSSFRYSEEMSYYQSSDGEVDDDVRLPRSMSTHPLEEEFFHEALTDPHETDKVSSSSSSSSSSSLSSSSTSYHENQNQNQSESESESEPHPSQEGSPTDPSLVSTRLGSPLHQVNSMHSEHPFQAMGGGMSTSTELNLNAPPFVPRFL